MIHQADVFQLFWSRNSMNSDYVHQEYSYALSLHRDGFVRPVYWEDPMPESKEKKLPPPELQEIHFHRISPLTRTEPRGQQDGLERTMPGSSPMQTADLRTLRSIKLVGVVAFFSISLVALGMGIYWRARTHSSPEAQIAKSAHNDGSPVSGMPSVSVDVGGPVTTLPAVPPIFHEAENIPRHGAATTKPPPVDTQGMVRIPGGKFKMGSPEKEVGRLPIESPQHPVSVDAFMMDETEVTNEMYQRFVMDKPEWQKGHVAASLASQFYLENWEGIQYPANKEKYPVAYVSWYAARAYCEWVNKRLPTEAEWEYAARAGTTTAFWWGDEWNGKFANASRQSADSVDNPEHRNKFGLFDMLGNVWEWTSTRYSRYPYNAKDGREDQNSSAARVMRGGSWGVGSEYLRSATRVRESSEFTREDVGFRCAYSGS
jgi:formylglycine-generating enzyme required for sulfatase activity